MIRINLLPVRAAKKKESVRFQLTVAALITLFVISVVVALYFTIRGETAGLSAEIAAGEKEIEDLKLKIGELSRIKEQKKIVEEKLKIVKSLEIARTGPTNMFIRLGAAIPEKAWLTSVKDDGYSVVLKGYAETDEAVADFMRGLERFKELGRVELEVAQRMIETETKADVVSFSILLERPRETKGKDAQEKKN
jgi:type IV pilus assembly protein PilN